MVNATHQNVVECAAFRLGEAAHRVGCSRRFLEKQIAAGRLRCNSPVSTMRPYPSWRPGRIPRAQRNL